jgi:hypothetical protein
MIVRFREVFTTGILRTATQNKVLADSVSQKRGSQDRLRSRGGASPLRPLPAY